jgi:hypothetical protein
MAGLLWLDWVAVIPIAGDCRKSDRDTLARVTTRDDRRSWQMRILWIGATLYTVSFFLSATSDIHPLQGSNPANPGWACAVYALVLPLQVLLAGAPAQGKYAHPIAWAELFVTGCINPLFLVTIVGVLRNRLETVGVLRIVLFVMILCCGIVFYTFQMYPREGFLVWVLGMLLVVSSAELGGALAHERQKSGT